MAMPSARQERGQVLSPHGSALVWNDAGNTVEENFNSSAAPSQELNVCCTSNSLALNGPAFGAVAPESAIREVVLAGDS